MTRNEKLRIRYTIPTTRDQGSCTIIGVHSPMETCAQNALWDYNSSRAHDGQPPLANLPRGTTSEVLAE